MLSEPISFTVVATTAVVIVALTLITVAVLKKMINAREISKDTDEQQ